jgi:hypothetical protein
MLFMDFVHGDERVLIYIHKKLSGLRSLALSPVLGCRRVV